MSDEILAEVAAPEQEPTAVPETVVTEPETQEPVEETPKTFTQEELDAIVGKRLAKAERQWQREQAARAVEAPKPVPTTPPTADQFETYEQYAEALAERKAVELVRQREIARQVNEIESTYAEREEKAIEKYDDFREVAYNDNLPITPEMAATIKESEVGPDLAYWLGSNPKEASRISRLSPLQQARELGKIEAKLDTSAPVKKTSSAPAPIKPVTARTTNNPSYDTTDPRSTKTMTDSEWIEAERRRQIRNLEAQHRR